MSWSYSSLIGSIIVTAISVPLAILALITSSLAFGTLFARVAVVYAELGLALLNSWLSPEHNSSKNNNTKRESSRRTSSPTHSHSLSHAERAEPWTSPSRASTSSSDTSTSRPLSAYDILPEHKPPSKSESFASLVGTGGANRDFEGVGGWRFVAYGGSSRSRSSSSAGAGMSDSFQQDGDEGWMLNSRLQLPMMMTKTTATTTKANSVAGTNAGVDQGTRRHHRRSFTSQSQRLSRSPIDLIRTSSKLP